MFKSIGSVEETCIFNTGTWDIPEYDGAQQNLYYCTIIKAKLVNESETLITITTSKSKSNLEVRALQYYQGTLSFISSSSFSTFPNLEIFFVGDGQSLEVIKPEHFKNADNLKVLWISGNNISKLETGLFVSAQNLTYINLQSNKISNIHRLAFHGLQKLQQLYLNGNQIKNLHPETFKYLIRLQTLNLLSVFTCVNEKFNNASKQTKLIHDMIRKFCDYSLFADELVEIELNKKIVAENLIKIMEHEKTVNNLSAINKELSSKNRILEENLKILNDTLETKFLELSRILKEQLETFKQENTCFCTNELPKLAQDIKNNSDNIIKISDQFEKKSLVNFSVLVKLIQDQKLIIDGMNEEVTQTCKKDINALQNLMMNVDKGYKGYETRFLKIEETVADILKDAITVPPNT